MKKTLLLICLMLLLFVLTGFRNPNTHNIVLTSGGYEPQKVVVEKGGKIVFRSNLADEFWPASDPHPIHGNYPELDPTKPIKGNQIWEVKLNKAGIVNYHDHIKPNLRGSIVVEDPNPFTRFIANFSLAYRKNFEKHDYKFIAKNNKKCGKPDWSKRAEFDKCWDDFFAKITKDFGAAESMRLVKLANVYGFLSNSDCHNRADNVGIDSYWIYTINKFDFTKDFYVCQEGFFHGFMMEHVSHTKLLPLSVEICESLDNSDSVAIDQCYVGIGGGLTFLYWGEYGNNTERIVTKSLDGCSGLETGRDYCVYGVYGGLEHLYTGFHGSNMTIDSVKPFDICIKQKNLLYRNYCIERLRGPMFSVEGYKMDQIANRIQSMPIDIKKFIAKELGRYLVLHQIYNSESDVTESLLNCRGLPKLVVSSCFEGGFDELFINDNEFNRRYSDFDCDSKVFNLAERSLCKRQRITNLE